MKEFGLADFDHILINLFLVNTFIKIISTITSIKVSTSKIFIISMEFKYEVEHLEAVNGIVYRTTKVEDIEAIVDFFFEVYLKGNHILCPHW